MNCGSGCPVLAENAGDNGTHNMPRQARHGDTWQVAVVRGYDWDGSRDATDLLAADRAREPRACVHIRPEAGSVSGHREDMKSTCGVGGANDEAAQIVRVGRARGLHGIGQAAHNRIACQVQE